MLFLGALCPNQQNVYDVWMQDFQEPVVLQCWHIYRQDTRLVWVMGGICLAFGRKKPIPVTFHCSLGQLINGVAITVFPEGQEHVLPCWPLVISTQVKRDYAETDGRGGGRKLEAEINEDAKPRFPKKSL